MERDHWGAYLSEDLEEDEHGPIATGLFSGHLEAEFDGAESNDWTDDTGIESVSADAAIAWARERASRVIVRLASSWDGPSYSAGVTPIEGLRPWDESNVVLGRRRPEHWQFVDRTEQDEPIEWDVLLRAIQYEGEPVSSFADELRRELDADPWVELLGVAKDDGPAKFGVSDVELVADSPTYMPSTAYGLVTVWAKLSLKGRTVAEAREKVRRIAESAGARTTPSNNIHTPRWDFAVDVYPTGSRLAAVNIRF